MIKLYAVTLGLLCSAHNLRAQYCTSVGPSSTADSNLESFYLAGESATSINFIGCPGVIGLDDQTLAQSIVLNANGTYNATAEFGTCGGNYPGVGQGWIDYNQNQIFETSESIGTWSGLPPAAPAAWNFTVPAGAISGSTRMRIVHFEGGVLPLDPCAVFTWGSTTDFTVQIGGGMDCSGYTGQSTADPRPVTSLPFSESHSNAVCYYNILPVYSSADVFYRILPVQLGAQYITVSLCGSAIDTYLSILDDDGNVIYYNDDNAGCGTGSKIHFDAGTHDTLYAVVQGWGFQMGNYSILVEEELASVNEHTSFDFSIYPNPAKNSVTLDFIGNEALISLTDLSGKLIRQQMLNSGDQLDLSEINAGTYFVTVLNEKGKSIQKLIIQ